MFFVGALVVGALEVGTSVGDGVGTAVSDGVGITVGDGVGTAVGDGVGPFVIGASDCLHSQILWTPRAGSPNTPLLQPIVPEDVFWTQVAPFPYLTVPLHLHVPHSREQCFQTGETLVWVFS